MTALLELGPASRGVTALGMFEQEPILAHRGLSPPHPGHVERHGYPLYFGAGFDNLPAFFAGEPVNPQVPGALDEPCGSAD